jgi:hypothetical protein
VSGAGAAAPVIARPAVETQSPPDAPDDGRSYHLEILLVSFATLLIEISYTRVVSFKLYYYYTYLVIGLALLGIGAGGVLVATSKRLRNASSDAILLWTLPITTLSVIGTYILVANVSINTLDVWHYGTAASVRGLLLLVAMCVLVFIPFVTPGIVLATLFGRRPDKIGGLYFADLAGAGLACAIVVYLTATIGPPATIMLSGLALALAALRIAFRRRSKLFPVIVLLVALSATLVAAPGLLPSQRVDPSKAFPTTKAMYTSWSPVFRIDVFQATPNVRLLYHDGILGSAIYRWNGTRSFLKRYNFPADPRSIPFTTLGTAPKQEAILGAAGGHEVLTSLYYGAGHVDAVELNPVTYSLVKTTYAAWDGHLAQNPHVNYVNGDGRSFMARTDKKYGLIWYPAPDSYSATNAAAVSAFVLSEAYLYTTNGLKTDFSHLTKNGIFVAQFGEVDYANRPYRTARFVATARQALKEMGITDPASHILVATSPVYFLGHYTFSTIEVKTTPFSAAEVSRFVKGLKRVPGTTVAYAPGHPVKASPVSIAASAGPAKLANFYNGYKYNVVPTSDNDPFFYHFVRYGTVLKDLFHSINTDDREDAVGERVLVLLLGISVIVALVFLLAPFLAIRRTWRKLPRKGRSALFFASLGFGFIFFEVTLIQLLNLFLGYPTYALTVTLMSLLIFTGIGAYLSGRRREQKNTVPVLLVAITALTVFYLFGLTPMTDALLSLAFALRVLIAFAVLAPLGLCLGMFMPLGLERVSGLSEHPREYVAWGWAVNGFASVTGSVLATILSMIVGFDIVLVLGLGAYVLAVIAWMTLSRPEIAAASP